MDLRKQDNGPEVKVIIQKLNSEIAKSEEHRVK